jgi:hypothetical protein
MLDNLGLRGHDVLTEAYEHLAADVERWFEEESVSVGAAPAVVVLPPHELACVCPQRSGVRLVGASLLDRAVAVLLSSPDTGRVGCCTLVKAAGVEQVLAALVADVLEQERAGVEPASFGGSWTLTDGKRQRGGRVLDAFVVGGYCDAEGVCEATLRAALNALRELEARFNVRLFCAGRLNDSHANGNEEDREGPRCAMVTAAALEVLLPGAGAVAGSGRPFECRPVALAGAPGEPAPELRLCRSFLRRCRPADESGEVWLDPVASSLTRVWSETLAAPAKAQGVFVIEPFELEAPDKQTTALLLHLAAADEDHFLELLGAKHLQASRAMLVQSLCRALRCFCDLRAGRGPGAASEALFANGPLTFTCGAAGSWRCGDRGVAPVLAALTEERTLPPVHQAHPHLLL